MEQTKATENLSQWFNLAEQTPWEPGVYEVQCTDGLRFSEWNGEKWGITNKDKCSACDWRIFSGRHTETTCEIYAWRGLSSDPSAKPKARGNRRVTRYVVMDNTQIDTPLGVFSCPVVAANHAAKFKWAEVVKIRFRTPEAS